MRSYAFKKHDCDFVDVRTASNTKIAAKINALAAEAPEENQNDN